MIAAIEITVKGSGGHGSSMPADIAIKKVLLFDTHPSGIFLKHKYITNHSRTDRFTTKVKRGD